MLKSPLIPRILLVLAIVALAILVLGIFQEVQASRRVDELASIPIDPLVQDATTNQTSAQALALITKQKDDAEAARGQSFVIIGTGAVLLGIVAFVYSRLPDHSSSPK